MGRIYDLFVSKYNHTDFHELNLDWLIAAIKQMEYEIENFVSINAVKYADPIEWDITRSYEKNTIVIEPTTGTAYISAHAVPRGIDISRDYYWNVVFDLSRFIVAAAKNFADSYESLYTATATVPTDKGKWVVWNSTLYEALSDIDIGDAYVENGNIIERTVEYFYDLLKNGLTQEIQDRQDADAQIVIDLSDLITSKVGIEARTRSDEDIRIEQELIDLITSEVGIVNGKIGDINSLLTTDKDSVVDAVNEIVGILSNIDELNVINVVSDIGCDNDGTTDCAQAINDYLSTDTSGSPLVFPYGTYKIDSTINIVDRDVYILGQVFTRTNITMFRISGQRHKFIFNKLGYSTTSNITSTDAPNALATAIEVKPDDTHVCNALDIIGNYIMCDTGIKFTGYGTGFIQNINVKVDYFLNRTNCVYADLSSGQWISEIIFTGGSFNCYQDSDPSTLIKLYEPNHSNLMNGWRFIGCAFENFNTVFDLEGAKVFLTNCRMARYEGFSATSSKYFIAKYSSTFNFEGNIEFGNVDQNFTLDSSTEGILTGYINNGGMIGTSAKVMNDGTNQFAFIDQGALGKAFNHAFTANNQTISCGYGFDLSKGVEINVGTYTGCTVNVVYSNNYRPAAGSDGGYYTGLRPFVVTVTGSANVTLATPNGLGGGATHTLAGGSSYLITRNKTIQL